MKLVLTALLALVLPAAAGAAPPPLAVAGAYHACSGTSTELRCWGSNTAGELGNGTVSTRSLSPVKVKNLPTPILEVGASYDRTCALTGSGVYCWGRLAKVSSGKWVAASTPTKVSSTPSSAHGLAVGVKHACILNAANESKCWGVNDRGEIGDGTKTIRTSATKSKLPPAVDVEASDGYTCALLVAGGVACVGISHGTEGDPANPEGLVVSSTTPKTIAGYETATSIAATGDFVCAVLAGGLVSCLGENDHGQLGDGTTAGRSSPAIVAGLLPSAQVVASANHACSLSTVGTIDCWGRGDHGQMGDGTTVDRFYPGPVSQPSTPTRLLAGASGHYTIALGSSSFAWGRNEDGVLLDGTTADRPTPIAIALPGATA